MNTWRAGCGGSRTSGSEGGPRKPTSRNADRAPGPDPYTYVSTWAGWVYVAFVTDAYARRILGWRCGSSMTAQLVLDAPEQAIWTRQRTGADGDGSLEAVVAHSDRGAQYTSLRYGERLTDAGITPSVGSVGDSYDCETVLRRSSRCDPCYDWPCGCPGVDLSAGSSGASEVALRAGSDLIGA